MKRIFLYVPMLMLLVSCIQDEPLNAEADITDCKILNDKGKAETNIKGNIVINNTQVLAQATPRINLTRLALEVKLTEGATISPDPSQLLDYSQPRKFTVTSQDGNWNKEYLVSIDTFDLPVKYDFGHFELNETGKYQVFYEEVKGHNATFKQYIWASGNSGYQLTGVGRTPEDYPTVPLKQGANGTGVKLETKSTGDFGERVKMPIAAGNLFLGSFDVTKAVEKPLQATRFGLPFGKKPLWFKGKYKYRPGQGDFTAKDKNGKKVVIPGWQDSGDIYAVLYEAAGLEASTLDGNNVLTSPNVVAMARVDVVATEDFIEFKERFQDSGKREIKWPSFIYRDNTADGDGSYRPFDEAKLRNNEYNLAVVFTSSKYGAYFAGAVGSILYVDQVEVICE